MKLGGTILITAVGLCAVRAFNAGISPFTTRGCSFNRLNGPLYERSGQSSWNRVAPSFSSVAHSLQAIENGPGKTSRSATGVLRTSDEDQVEVTTTPVPKAHPAFDALIDQFTSPQNGNITATVEEYLDLCDHAFLTHLHGRIKTAGEQTDMGIALKNVEEEINMAMQRRLTAADTNLRRVLDLAPDIKKMESNIRTLFREGKLDMAFMVMLNMNLQKAKEAQGAEHAVMLLTHLNAFINEFQDERLNPEVKLLRVLLRTDCDGVRKSMLQERLQLANHDIFLERPPDKDKVQPHLLQRAIIDMIEQVEELGQAIDAGLTESLQGLRTEVDEVVKGNQRPGPFKQ